MTADKGTELVFGIVAPIGADRNQVYRLLNDALALHRYQTKHVKLSRIIETVKRLSLSGLAEYERLTRLMDAGNELRESSDNEGVLGLAAASAIQAEHDRVGWDEDDRRFAFVVETIKHPGEVHVLRQAYPGGFFLIGLHVDEQRRRRYLTQQKGLSAQEATKLIRRDESEALQSGQSTQQAFHLSDFFVHYDGHEDKLRNSLGRIVRLVFGHPYTPPTFNEYAMYVAFASGMRSCDLSRQVGAAVAIDNRIVSTGANEAPRFGGGQYWSEYDNKTKDVVDTSSGRDYRRGMDSNQYVKDEILDEMIEAIGGSTETREQIRSTAFSSITEYGRAVHAEMEAILSCARSAQSTLGADLYTTTFPCHNCAKHIVGAGIRRIFFVEPYPKSRALELHDDSLSDSRDDFGKKTVLRPFVGVGPRQYVNSFSMDLAAGPALRRKDRQGAIVDWTPANATPRGRMMPASYRELEDAAARLAAQCLTEEV